MQSRTATPKVKTLSGYLIELVVVFVGVALAFAVENLREDLNERNAETQYLGGFRQDLLADLEMLRLQQEARQTQLKNALVALEFFEGRPIDPQAFFETYYPALRTLNVSPNRNTMDEVLNSGNLRLIRDTRVRSGLLDLYSTYDRVVHLEAHMDRDFDAYLYDPTFSSIPLQFIGPWEDSAENRRAVEVLINNLAIENGLRLIVVNLQETNSGLLAELQTAQLQVEALLRVIPEG